MAVKAYLVAMHFVYMSIVQDGGGTFDIKEEDKDQARKDLKEEEAHDLVCQLVPCF